MKDCIKKWSTVLIGASLCLSLSNIAYSVTWPNAPTGKTYPEYLSSDYGPRTGYTYHYGLDFPDDKNVRAVEAGIVTIVSGKLIIIEGAHIVRYYHMGKIDVKEKQQVKEGEKIGEYEIDHVDIKLSTFTNPLRDLFSSLYTGSRPSIKNFKLIGAEEKDGKYYITKGTKKVTMEAYIETTTKDLDIIEFSFNPSISGFPIKFDYHNWNLKPGMRWKSICNKAAPAKDTFYYDWTIPEDVEDGEYKLKVTAKTVKGKESTKEIIVVIEPSIFVTIHPIWQNFTRPHESHTHYITITNKSKTKSYTANIKMKVIKKSRCLSVTRYPATTLELPPNSQVSTSFVIISGEELIPEDNFIHQIIVV